MDTNQAVRLHKLLNEVNALEEDILKFPERAVSSVKYHHESEGRNMNVGPRLPEESELDKLSTLDKWATTLPFWRILTHFIRLRLQPHCSDELRDVCKFSETDWDCVSENLGRASVAMICRHAQILDGSFRNLDAASTSANIGKFLVVKAECGRVSDFHGGLARRIGNPHVDFEFAMKAEHCSKSGSKFSFTSTNYSITTTPENEWMITVNGKECPEHQMKYGRTIRNMDQLMKKPLAVKAKLQKVEVIAVVLYTGPMYTLYNAILRRFPCEIYSFLESCKNLFSTTIFVFVSAIQKLSRVTEIPAKGLLYRGLGGLTELPDAFYQKGEDHSRGMAEWGFMSTTSNQQTAIQYSGVVQNRPLALVLVMKASAIDRGASVSEFSQYPTENEYVWPPCSFLEPEGPEFLDISDVGVVTMVPVRVNANLKSLTIEEMKCQKKASHLSSLRYRIDEIRVKFDKYRIEIFEDTLLKQRLHSESISSLEVSTFFDKIIDECEALYCRHQDVPDENYNVEEGYRSLVTEMLEVSRFAQSKINLWRHDSSWGFNDVDALKLRKAHRLSIDFNEKQVWKFNGQERVLKALEVCKAKGLVIHEISETNDLGECPILSAAATGCCETDFSLLEAAGGNLHSRTSPDERSAVFLAAENGHSHTILALHALNADVNATDLSGWTPLFSASSQGHIKCIQVLIRLSAAINIKDYGGRTALHLAAESGHRNAVQLLVDCRADPQDKDDTKKSAIWYAGYGAHAETVLFLCSQGANIRDALEGAWTRGVVFGLEIEKLLPPAYTLQERASLATAFQLNDELHPDQLEQCTCFRFQRDDLAGIERTDRTIRVVKILSDMMDPIATRNTLISEVSGFTKGFVHCGQIFKILIFGYTADEARLIRGKYDIGQRVREEQVSKGKFFFRTSDFVAVDNSNGCFVVGCVLGSGPEGCLHVAVENTVMAQQFNEVLVVEICRLRKIKV